MTGPGKPIETASYFQSLASFLTPSTICLAVNVGPDGNSTKLLLPGSEDFHVRSAYVDNEYIHSEAFSNLLLAGLRKGGALGNDYTHKLVPRIDERLAPSS